MAILTESGGAFTTVYGPVNLSSATRTTSFTTQRILWAGDYLRFTTGYGADRSATNDATRIEVTIRRIPCGAGQHRCSTACLSDTRVSSCGISCMLCSPPPNATPPATARPADSPATRASSWASPT